jgi:hypothetical protein
VYSQPPLQETIQSPATEPLPENIDEFIARFRQIDEFYPLIRAKKGSYEDRLNQGEDVDFLDPSILELSINDKEGGVIPLTTQYLEGLLEDLRVQKDAMRKLHKSLPIEQRTKSGMQIYKLKMLERETKSLHIISLYQSAEPQDKPLLAKKIEQLYDTFYHHFDDSTVSGIVAGYLSREPMAKLAELQPEIYEVLTRFTDSHTATPVGKIEMNDIKEFTDFIEAEYRGVLTDVFDTAVYPDQEVQLSPEVHHKYFKELLENMLRANDLDNLPNYKPFAELTESKTYDVSSSGRIEIPNALSSIKKLRNTPAHEILGHVRRTAELKKRNLIRPPKTTATEEGIASVIGDYFEGLDTVDPAGGIAITMIALKHAGATMQQIKELYLLEGKKTPDDINRLLARVFKGTNGTFCFEKDCAYTIGKLNIAKYCSWIRENEADKVLASGLTSVLKQCLKSVFDFTSPIDVGYLIKEGVLELTDLEAKSVLKFLRSQAY